MAWLPSWLTSSIFTTMSGNAVMNARAISVIAVRPTDGAQPSTVRDPFSVYNDASLTGFWLLQAAA
jgi:hypothetical protein